MRGVGKSHHHRWHKHPHRDARRIARGEGRPSRASFRRRFFTREERIAGLNLYLDGLRAEGIGCNNYFSPIHLQPFYQASYGLKAGDFPVCEALAERTIALPFHAFLEEGDVDRVVTALRALL